MPGQDYSSTFAPITSANPLQQAGGVAGLQSQLLANQAQQQEFKARQAMGPVLQAAVDPQTGVLDPNKALLGFASHPDLAWKAPDLVKMLTENGLTTAKTANETLDAAIKRNDAISQAAAARLGSGQEITGPSILADARTLVKNERITEGEFTQLAQKVMGTPEGPMMKGLLSGIALNSQKVLDTLKMVKPDIQRLDTGPMSIPYQNQPVTGQVNYGTPVPKGMAPAQGEALVPVRTERGEEWTPRGNLPTSGRGSVVAPPPTTVGVGGQPGPISAALPQTSQGGGAPTQGGAPSQTPGAPAPQGKGPPPPDPLNPPQTAPMPLKSLSPQIEEGWKKMGADYDQVQKRLTTAQSMMQAISTAENALKTYTPGAGGELRIEAAQAASALGAPQALVEKIANGKLASAQVFQSVMLDLASARMKQALEGGGRFTNTEFNAFTTSKPNPNMSPEAVRELFEHYKRGIMLDQQLVKGYNHFMKEGKAPGDFSDWWSDRLSDYQKMMKEHQQ